MKTVSRETNSAARSAMDLITGILWLFVSVIAFAYCDWGVCLCASAASIAYFELFRRGIEP